MPREEEGEYSPIFSKDNPSIRDYLKSIGVLVPLSKSQQPSNQILAKLLQFLRTQCSQLPHEYIVWSVSWILVPILMSV